MNLKIVSDAEVYQTTNQGKSIGRRVFVPNCNQIIDCDELQAQKNAVKPRIIEDVIVA